MPSCHGARLSGIALIDVHGPGTRWITPEGPSNSTKAKRLSSVCPAGGAFTADVRGQSLIMSSTLRLGVIAEAAARDRATPEGPIHPMDRYRGLLPHKDWLSRFSAPGV